MRATVTATCADDAEALAREDAAGASGGRASRRSVPPLSFVEYPRSAPARRRPLTADVSAAEEQRSDEQADAWHAGRTQTEATLSQPVQLIVSAPPLPPAPSPDAPTPDFSSLSTPSELRAALLSARVALAQERLACEQTLARAGANKREMRAHVRARELAAAQEALSHAIATAERASVPVAGPEADLLSHDPVAVAHAVEALSPMRADADEGDAGRDATQPEHYRRPQGACGSDVGADPEAGLDRSHAIHLDAVISTVAAIRSRVEAATYDRCMRAALAPMQLQEAQQPQGRPSLSSPLQLASTQPSAAGVIAASLQPNDAGARLASALDEREALSSQLQRLRAREEWAGESIERHSAAEAEATARCQALLARFHAAQEAASAAAVAAQRESEQLTEEVRRLTEAASSAPHEARARAGEMLEAHIQQAVAAEEARLAAKLSDFRAVRAGEDARTRSRVDAQLSAWLTALVHSAAKAMLASVHAKAVSSARLRSRVVDDQREVAAGVLAVHDTRRLLQARAVALASAEADQALQEEQRQAHAAARERAKEAALAARGGADIRRRASLAASARDAQQPFPSPLGREVDAWAAGLRGGSETPLRRRGSISADAAGTGRRGSAFGIPASPAAGATILSSPPVSRRAIAVSATPGGRGARSNLLSPAQLNRALSSSAAVALASGSGALPAPSSPVARETAWGPASVRTQAFGGLSRVVVTSAPLPSPLAGATRSSFSPRASSAAAASAASAASATSSPSGQEEAAAAFAALTASWDADRVPLEQRLRALLALSHRLPYSAQLADAWWGMGEAVHAAGRLTASLRRAVEAFPARAQEWAEREAAGGSGSPASRSPSSPRRRPGSPPKPAPSPPRIDVASLRPDSPAAAGPVTDAEALDLAGFLDLLRATAPADALPPAGQPIPSLGEPYASPRGRKGSSGRAASPPAPAPPAVVTVSLMEDSDGADGGFRATARGRRTMPGGPSALGGPSRSTARSTARGLLDSLRGPLMVTATPVATDSSKAGGRGSASSASGQQRLAGPPLGTLAPRATARQLSRTASSGARAASLPRSDLGSAVQGSSQSASGRSRSLPRTGALATGTQRQPALGGTSARASQLLSLLAVTPIAEPASARPSSPLMSLASPSPTTGPSPSPSPMAGA